MENFKVILGNCKIWQSTTIFMDQFEGVAMTSEVSTSKNSGVHNMAVKIAVMNILVNILVVANNYKVTNDKKLGKVDKLGTYCTLLHMVGVTFYFTNQYVNN